MSRILLVDSDLTECHSISRTLNGLGFSLDVAYDATQARVFAARKDYRVGLFEDQLEDGRGVQLFEELRCKQVPMAGILLTSVGNLQTVTSAVQAGMTRVLAKPIDFSELVTLIDIPGRKPAHVETNASGGRRFTEESIAKLPLSEIKQDLTASDLVEIIRSVDYPFAGKGRLEYFDRDTLERVVCLIRRWCRNRLQMACW